MTYNTFSILKYIPSKFYTQELCELAVEYDPENFGYVPKKFISKKMYYSLIKHNNNIKISKIPKNFRDTNIIRYAISNYYTNIRYAAKEILSEEFILKLLYKESKNKYNDIEVCTILSNLPKECITEKICYVAAHIDGRSLAYIPDNLKTKKICFEAVKNNGSALEYVPDNIITYELCIVALSPLKKPWKLRQSIFDAIPHRFIDSNLCIKAVQANGEILHNIPREFWTYEICLEAVKSDGYMIKFIPDEFKNIEMYKASVKTYGITIFYLPENERTIDMWKQALLNCHELIKFIPSKYLNNELISYAKFSELRKVHNTRGYDSVEIVRDMRCSVEETCDIFIEDDTPYDMLKAIVGLWPLNIVFVNEKRYTHELLLIASKTGGIGYIKKNFITTEMCYYAVKNDSVAIIHDIPKKMLTKEICKIALKESPSIFKFIPYKFRDKELVNIAIDAVKINNEDISLKNIPNRFRSKSVCITFIKKNACNIQYIPKRYKNMKFYKEAIIANAGCLEYIPHQYITNDIYIGALHHKISVIKYIPDNYKTKSTCDRAITSGINLIQFIPKKFITNNIVKYIISVLRNEIFENNTYISYFKKYEI